MKSYKPLVSSAPAHSILNARTFRYRNSAETDIRKTFARVRQGPPKQGVAPNTAPNVRPFTKHFTETVPPSAPRPLRRSSA